MMLHEQIEHDYLEAFKARRQAKVDVLRLIKAAIKNREIELRHQHLTDEEVIAVMTKEAKRRREAIAMYEQGGRPELAAKENAELQELMYYLPTQLSDGELETIIASVIAELKATPKDFGRVMSAAMAKAEGQADGSRVSAAVKKVLH